MLENDIKTTQPELDPENVSQINTNMEDTTMLNENTTPETIETEATALPEDITEETAATPENDESVAEKPKATRTRRTAKKSDDAESEADSAEDILEQEARAAVNDTADRTRRNAARRRERARKQRMEAPLDADGRPIVDGNGTFDPNLAEVFQKRNTREVVSGTIDEVKMGRNGGEGWVEVMYNDFRVLIPFSEMDITIEDRRSGESAENYATRLGRTISNMIGARIEFVISGVESEERLAAGSRKMATRARRRSVLDAKDREGNYLIYPDRQVSASVLAVHKEFAFVDVYGMRCRLRASDIRADYVTDVNDELENGMTIPVYITHVARNDDGEVSEMFISMRNDKAEKEKLQNSAASMKEGDICRGRISARTKDAIFITLSNGLQAYAYVSNGLQGRKVPNIGDNVSLRVTRVNENRRNGNPIVLGKIVRNINYAAR